MTSSIAVRPMFTGSQYPEVLFTEVCSRITTSSPARDRLYSQVKITASRQLLAMRSAKPARPVPMRGVVDASQVER